MLKQRIDSCRSVESSIARTGAKKNILSQLRTQKEINEWLPTVDELLLYRTKSWIPENFAQIVVNEGITEWAQDYIPVMDEVGNGEVHIDRDYE